MAIEPQHHFIVSEADIDLLLAEELACNSQFRSWFLTQTGSATAPADPPLLLGRSVSTYDGESDLLLVHREKNGTRRAMLIENKISASPTVAQGERYVVRGEKGVSEGRWDEFITVLVAPERYLSHSTMRFGYQISYEQILAQFSQTDARGVFKRRLIEIGIRRSSKPWEQVVDQALSAWFVQARAFGTQQFPDLPLPEEKPRAPKSTWMIFAVPEFPMSRLTIEIKPHHGHVDLRFGRVAIGEMRRALREKLPVGADTIGAKKSCAIRFTHPAADVRLGFDMQKELVRPLMASADTLLKFAHSERSTIMKLLGYELIA